MKYYFQMVGDIAVYKSERVCIKVVGVESEIDAATEEDKQKAQKIVEAVQNLMELL